MIASQRIVAGCLLILSGCGLAGCNASSKADTADDTKQWQGTWKVVSVVWNGETQTADAYWRVEGDHYTVRLNGRDAETDAFKLDAAEKHVDVFHHDTPKGTYGGSAKGLYEIKGDVLRVCLDLTARQYPKSFEAKAGSRLASYEFRRERP
jgi:uncharacterized protein (TIGR03067 family)